ERHEDQPERVGAGVQADGILHAEILREIRLELLQRRALNVLVALEDLENRVVEFLLDAVILTDVAVEGGLDFRHGLLSSILIPPMGTDIITFPGFDVNEVHAAGGFESLRGTRSIKPAASVKSSAPASRTSDGK